MLKNEVNYKALAFIAEQTASTFNYEVKGVRALWDPSLSIPGTNRRGGWRCPVGTRYGGQITDRFGRSCGWGVARRIANQIADIGARLESIDDRKRNNRLGKRNARMQRFLARQDKPGLLERGARGIADALDGGGVAKPINAPRAPRAPRALNATSQRKPDLNLPDFGKPRIYDQGMRVNDPRQDSENVRQFERELARRRRGNLRESEARRMEREIVQPGAPRTGEPPAQNAPRRRRRNAAQQGAKRTVRRKPEADFVDSPPPKPILPARRVDVVQQRQEYLAKLDKDLKKQKREALANRPDGVSNSDWKKYRDHVNGLENQFGFGGNDNIAYVPSYNEFITGEQDILRRIEQLKPKTPAKPKPAARVKPPEPPKRPTEPSSPIPSPPPMPPTPKAPAPVQPARPAGPPGMRKQIVPEFEFDRPEDANLVRIVEDDIANYKPNAYNNLRNLDKDGLKAKQENAKREQLVLDQEFELAFAEWNKKKGGGQDEREAARNALMNVHLRREKNNDELDAVKMRITEVDAGIEFRPKPQNRAGIVVAQPPVRPPDIPTEPPARPPDLTEPEGGWDVSPPKAKDGHAPEKLNKLGSDGLPDVKSVPLGNAGIDEISGAIDHLEKGGDLADVPDELLGQALHGAKTRFSREDAGGGVNGGIVNNMHMFTDKITGKKYFLKYQTGAMAENEDIHEVIGNHIAGRLGMPVGGVRMDGKQKGGAGVPNSSGRAIVYEHAGNYVDGALQDGRNQIKVGQIKPADRVRATLLDYIMVNRDRHGGNFFIATDSNGVKRFVPIDPSLGFDAMWGGRVHENYDGDDAGLRGFLRNDMGGGRNEMLASLQAQVANGGISRREILLAVEEVQKSIREAERKNPYMGVVDGVLKSGGDGTAVPRNGDQISIRIGERPQKKMKYITDVDPGRIADLIIGS